MTPPPTLMFFVTEDWFFVSHFLAVAKAAREAGLTVVVHVRVQSTALQARIEADGIRVIPSTHRRGHFGPLALIGHVGRFTALLRREKPDIVHLVSVRMIVLAGLAARLAGTASRVQAVTGLGLMAASQTRKARLARAALGWVLRGPLGGRNVAYVFENREDPVLLGMDPDDVGVTVVGGAGIDPDREPELPLPSLPPIRLALVARMIASKGVDVAVAAVGQVRRAGHDVRLTLVGAPDSQNPRSFTTSQLESWGREDGVTWVGHSTDVKAIWRDHHVVCVPSRGGEGLPRSLLEGAAAGRAVVTTATPGCATFTRDGIEGFVVAPGDPAALTRAITSFALNPGLIARMGTAARARVLDGFTSAQVAGAFVQLYRRMLGKRFTPR